MPLPLFEIVPAEASATGIALRVGGTPPLAKEQWPRCATCGEPMAFRFTLVHQPEALDLSPFEAVRVFSCDDAAFKCRPDTADSGANQVVGATSAEEDTGTVRFGVLRPAHEDTAALTVDLNEATPEQSAAYEAAQEAAPKSKIGGVPIWLQGPQETSSDGAQMEMVAQLDGAAWGLSIGDGGALFVFRSAADPKRYTVLTQSY